MIWWKGRKYGIRGIAEDGGDSVEDAFECP